MSEHDRHIEQERLEGRVGSQFKEDLAYLFDSKRKVPPEVDGAILYKAQKHFGRSWRRRIVRWVSSSAAAAVILFVVLLNLPHRASYQPMVEKSRTIAGDIDHSGKVDILDAFELARDIKSGKKVITGYDFNEDGLLDGKDVDWLAMAAVRLNNGR